MNIESNSHLGGILTGIEIHERVNNGDIIIEPYSLDQLNPNSYNLRLGNKLKVYDYEAAGRDYIDAHDTNPVKEIEIPEDGIILYPNKLYIGHTVERTATDKFIPMINGRSSGGRLGLNIHVCAGFGDLGFDGTWTLEIVVVEPLKVYPGDEIAQVSFTTPFGDDSYKYRGRYYKQADPTESKFSEEKSTKSLASEAIEAYTVKNLINKIYYMHGDYWFTSRGYNVKTMDASLHLYAHEYVDPDDDNNIYSTETNKVVGRRFEVDGQYVYIRRDRVEVNV